MTIIYKHAPELWNQMLASKKPDWAQAWWTGHLHTIWHKLSLWKDINETFIELWDSHCENNKYFITPACVLFIKLNNCKKNVLSAKALTSIGTRIWAVHIHYIFLHNVYGEVLKDKDLNRYRMIDSADKLVTAAPWSIVYIRWFLPPYNGRLKHRQW